jgi:hypothetical protein
VLGAMERVRFTLALTIAQAVLRIALFLLFLLVLNWGLACVVSGTLVARLFTSAVVFVWCVCRKAGLSLRRLLVHTGSRIVLAGGVFAGECQLIQQPLPGECCMVFWLHMSLTMASYFPIGAVLLVDEGYRKRILTKLGAQRPIASKERTTTP